MLFPFGYGLSYTCFAYSNVRASAAIFKDVEGVTVSVDVTNTGCAAGKEIVQVYVHDRESGLARPEKELKGFAKVALAPGETKTVTIPLDFRAFAYYHPGYGQWIAEPGEPICWSAPPRWISAVPWPSRSSRPSSSPAC